MESSGYDQVWRHEARRKGLQGALLTCFVFLLCYFTAELARILKVGVPQPVWPLWPGCALLTAILLLARPKLWLVLLPAGLGGFLLYGFRTGHSVTSILY